MNRRGDGDISAHPPSYGIYWAIWICLLLLTSVTVGVVMIPSGISGTSIAVTIASLKAVLVLIFFMHLRHEKDVFANMVLVAIFTLALVLLLTFLDYPFRGGV